MDQEKILQKILVAVEGNTEAIQELRTDVVQLKTDVGELRTETQETREVVDFLKDHMVSRDELDSRLSEMKSEIISHINGFIILHQKLDTELAALRAKYDRLESYIHQLAQHAHIELQS